MSSDRVISQRLIGRSLADASAIVASVLADVAFAEAVREADIAATRLPVAKGCCPTCRREFAGHVEPGLIVAGLDLSPGKRRIAETLAKNFGVWLSTERLIAALYRDDPDGGPLTAENVVATHVTALRIELAPYGLRIEKRRSSGRRMIWKDAALTNNARENPNPQAKSTR